MYLYLYGIYSIEKVIIPSIDRVCKRRRVERRQRYMTVTLKLDNLYGRLLVFVGRESSGHLFVDGTL